MEHDSITDVFFPIDLRRRLKFPLQQRPLVVRIWIVSDRNRCSKVHEIAQKWFTWIEQSSLLICILFVKLLVKLTFR